MLFIEDLEGNIFDIVFFIRKNNERACIFKSECYYLFNRIVTGCAGKT